MVADASTEQAAAGGGDQGDGQGFDYKTLLARREAGEKLKVAEKRWLNREHYKRTVVDKNKAKFIAPSAERNRELLPSAEEGQQARRAAKSLFPRTNVSLKTQVKQLTNNGSDLINFMLAVAHDDPLRFGWSEWPRHQQPKMAERMAAVDWLANRGWGRAIQMQEIQSQEKMVLELRWGDEAASPEQAALPSPEVEEAEVTELTFEERP